MHFADCVLRLAFCGWRFAVGVLRLAFCGWRFAVGVLRLVSCGWRFADDVFELVFLRFSANTIGFPFKLYALRTAQNCNSSRILIIIIFCSVLRLPILSVHIWRSFYISDLRVCGGARVYTKILFDIIVAEIATRERSLVAMHLVDTTFKV